MAEAHRDEIAKLEALYAANPEGRVFTHLAEAYRKAGELDLAAQILEDGLRRHPDSTSAYIVLGRIRFDRGEHDEAAGAFRRALELDGGNLIAHRFLADIAAEQGVRTEALHHYRELLNRNPGDPELKERVDSLTRSAVEVTEPERPALATGDGYDPGIRDYAESSEAGEGASRRDDQIGGEFDQVAPIADDRAASEGGLAAPTGEDQFRGEADAGQPAAYEFSLSEAGAQAPMAHDEERRDAGDSASGADQAGSEGENQASLPGGRAPDFPGDTVGGEQVDEVASPASGYDAAASEATEPTFAAAADFQTFSDQATASAEAEVVELPPEGFESHSLTGEDVVASAAGYEEEAEDLSQTEGVFGAAPDLTLALDQEDPLAMPGAGDLEDVGNFPETGMLLPVLSDEPEYTLEEELTSPDSEWQSPGTESAPELGLATETMAELYRKQGFHARAAEVYRLLLRERTDDERLRERLAEVEAEMGAAEERRADLRRSAEMVESAFTGASGASGDHDTPYAWSGAEDSAPAGTPIRDYFAALLAWRGSQSPGELRDPLEEAFRDPLEADSGVTGGEPELVAEVEDDTGWLPGELILDEEAASTWGAVQPVAAQPEPMPWVGYTAAPEVEAPASSAPDSAGDLMPWEAPELQSATPVPDAEAAEKGEPNDGGDAGDAAETDDHDEDEDLEMFRSWLQSLKK